MLSRRAGTLRTAGILLALYLVSTVLHLFLLRHAFQFPHISSDEVQYALTGDNIRLGRGFTLRGQFNSTLPPLFPAFVALAHSAGPDPRVGMFVLGCFVMCAAVFPVFAMARTCGLDRRPAILLAAAGTMLPHTFYAATYMTEVLQYPAYLTAFWLGFCWVENRTWWRDAAMGAAIGILLLTKLQGTQFAAAFLLAVVLIAIRSRRPDDRSLSRFLAHSAVVLAVAAGMNVAWYLYKLSYGGTALGAYGTILAAQGLPHWTPKLALAYCADFLLAPGLITAVPLFYWLRHNGSYRRTVFVLAVLGIQVIAVSTLDGGLTGWLRERLFLYALPITAVLAARGLAWFQLRQSSMAAYALPGVPLLLIPALITYPFAVSSVIEAPWANALGSLAGLLPFSRACLAFTAALSAVLVAFILLRTSAHAQVLFGAFVLLFYGASFVCSASALTAWTERGLRHVAPFIDWLHANEVRSGDRLLIAGRHAYFEDPSLTRNDPPDDRFVDWTWRLGLEESLEWQIETMGRYDVRIIPAPGAIATEARPGDRLLTVAQFDALNFRSFRYPLCLYRIDTVPATPPAAVYSIQFPAVLFQPEAGGHEFQLEVPPIPFGPYEVEIDPAGLAISFEIAAGSGRVLLREMHLPSSGPARFVNNSDTPLTLTLHPDSAAAPPFYGVNMRLLSAPAHFHPNLSTFVQHQSIPAGESISAPCFVDVINDLPPAGSITVTRGQGIQMLGWAASMDSDPASDQVYVELSSQTAANYWASARRYARPDVAKAFGKPALLESGFRLAAGLGAVPSGRLRLKILLLNRGRIRECDPGRLIEIR